MWRWSFLAFSIPVAYFGAMCLTFGLLIILWLFSSIGIKLAKVIDYLILGLLPSASLVVYFGMLLSAWVGYFGTEHGLKHSSTPHPQAFQYVTCTLVSFIVGSILWFLKVLFLLRWSDSVIYRRFEPRILITGVKFLYLGAIVGEFFASSLVDEIKLLDDVKGAQKNSSLKNYINSCQTCTHFLQEVGQTFTNLAQSVRTLQEDGVPSLLDCFLENHKFDQTTQACPPEEVLKLIECKGLTQRSLEAAEVVPQSRILHFLYQKFPIINLPVVKTEAEAYSKKAAAVLLRLVQEQAGLSEENPITFDDFKKWVVDAHMNCVNMGRTLADASAIVSRLDIFLSFIIFIIVVLLWLLITGIATTTVLVTIATPLLALAFIFGDSAKQFFQGIIFCFGTHAFDVGDRCIIDDIELEVKNMGILTTTFITIGTADKKIYPNSVLATKAIVNLGWEADPSDTVELSLDHSTKPENWQMLENKVDQFFNQQKENFQSASHSVTMKEAEDKIKVTIHFKHVLNVNEMTHGECFHKKNKQRSIILQKTSYFLDHSLPTENENGGLVDPQVLPKNEHHQPSTTSEITEL